MPPLLLCGIENLILFSYTDGDRNVRTCTGRLAHLDAISTGIKYYDIFKMIQYNIKIR